jgi:hypothetical protein
MIRQLLFVTTSVIAAAQPPGPEMSAPLLGYVFDGNAKAIRLISGVPGAASLDDIVSTNASLDSGFVHSRARVAIANTKEGSVVLIQWSGTPQVVALTTSLGRVTQAGFSLAGDNVAITDGATVEVWSGFGANPTKTAAFTPDGGVTAVAMNQNGLVAAATGAGSIVLLGDVNQQVAAGGAWTSLAFLPNGTDLLATDASAQSLVLIRNAQTDAASSVVLSLDQEADALAIASDGSLAALASPGAVTLVSLLTGQTTSVSCNCRTANFDRLEGNLVLHMADAQSGSDLLLDADAAQARVMTLFSVNGGSAQ